MMTEHRKFPIIPLSLFFFAAMLLAGCGSSGITVKGKVTTGGQPVKGGTLTFSPIAAGDSANPGKPSTAVIQADGTFKLEKATTGKSRVQFTPPDQVLSEAQRSDPTYKAPPAPYSGYTAKTTE